MLTHFDDDGAPRMVDVSDKDITARRARAGGAIRMAAETLALAEQGDAKKGDVVAVARLAGIMGAKRTADLIPLCHPLPLTKVGVEITADADLPGYRVQAEAACRGKTGVEMEALTAVQVALLTIYDMLKAADREMEIAEVKLLMKEGGRSGRYDAR